VYLPDGEGAISPYLPAILGKREEVRLVINLAMSVPFVTNLAYENGCLHYMFIFANNERLEKQLPKRYCQDAFQRMIQINVTSTLKKKERETIYGERV